MVIERCSVSRGGYCSTNYSHPCEQQRNADGKLYPPHGRRLSSRCERDCRATPPLACQRRYHQRCVLILHTVRSGEERLAEMTLCFLPGTEVSTTKGVAIRAYAAPNPGAGSGPHRYIIYISSCPNFEAACTDLSRCSATSFCCSHSLPILCLRRTLPPLAPASLPSNSVNISRCARPALLLLLLFTPNGHSFFHRKHRPPTSLNPLQYVIFC
jgi:hypothetical protein